LGCYNKYYIGYLAIFYTYLEKINDMVTTRPTLGWCRFSLVEDLQLIGLRSIYHLESIDCDTLDTLW
jgi:hypothetical protein